MSALIKKYYSVAYKCLLCRNWYTQKGLAETKDTDNNLVDEFECLNEECVCNYRVTIDKDGNGELKYNNGITSALAISDSADDGVHEAIEELCECQKRAKN